MFDGFHPPHGLFSSVCLLLLLLHEPLCPSGFREALRLAQLGLKTSIGVLRMTRGRLLSVLLGDL